MNAKELRKVYDAGYMKGYAAGARTTDPSSAARAFHNAALIAVARYVAQKQRDVCHVWYGESHEDMSGACHLVTDKEESGG